MAAPQDNDPLEDQLQRLRQVAQPELPPVARDRALRTRGAGGEARSSAPGGSGEAEAHRLAGALGVLGYPQGTDLARQLNLLFQGSSSYTPAQLALATDLIVGLRRALSRPPTEEHSMIQEAPPPEYLGTARVLLAEDDETIAAAIRVSLRLDGLEIVWARDGLEAVRLASEHQVDLALLDLGLPLFDGLEVCRRLRADPRLATIPIVLLTGRNDPRRAAAGTAEPCVTDYLAKPFQVSELRNRVRTLLASRDEASSR